MGANAWDNLLELNPETSIFAIPRPSVATKSVETLFSTSPVDMDPLLELAKATALCEVERVLRGT